MNAAFLKWLLHTVVLTGWWAGQSLHAAVVETCNEAGLRAALAAGGTVTFACDGLITLTSPITISTDTTLEGSGHAVTLSGGGTLRLLDVSPSATLGLVNLTLVDGRATGTPGVGSSAGGPGQGGAVRVQDGTLWASNCRFLGNKGVGGRGGDSTVLNPDPPGIGGLGEGGAIYASSSLLRLTNCVFESNTADGGRGGNVPNQPGVIRFGGLGGSSRGGAICALSSHLELQDTTVANSLANPGSQGNGTFSGDFPSTVGGAVYSDTSTGTIARCTWRNNGANTSGGAFFSRSSATTFSACTFENNSAGPSLLSQGGGILSFESQLRLTACIFRNNTAQGSGAFTLRSLGRRGGAAEGAAVHSLGGELAVTNCGFVANTAQGGDGMLAGVPLGVLDAGGARGGGVLSDGSAGMLNSTFILNEARAGHAVFSDQSRGGGGAVASVGGAATLSFCTIASNLVSDSLTLSTNSQGAGCYVESGTLTLDNSILSGNVANTGGSHGVPANAFGPILDGGHNLSSDPTPAFSAPGSRNHTDPMLGPPTYPDTPTTSLPLLPGSPAIDAADDASCPATDQRGVARPALSHCDIGAYEFVPELFAFTSISAKSGPNVILRGMGVPNQTFRLQAALHLFADWKDIGSGTVSPSGWFEMVTTNGNVREFYRALAP